MWFWVEIGNPSAGGGPIVLLAFAMMAVLFITPIAGTVIAIRSFIHKEFIPGIIALVVALAAAGYLIGTYVAVKVENKDYHRESDRLSIEIVGKENMDEDTFAFSFVVTNNTVERIVRTDIEMTVFNYDNKPLLKTDLTDIDCDTGVTKEFRCAVNAEPGDETQELYYTDYAYLRVEITIKALDYNDRDPEDYQFNDHRVLKEADTESLQSAYQDAIALFDAQKYEQAIEAFSKLGGYRDSLAQMKEAHRIIRENQQNAAQEALKQQYDRAVDLYNQGSYAAARELFESLKSYADSAQWVTKCETAMKDQQLEQQYLSAQDLLANKKYAEAYYAFYAIMDYKDSKALMTDIVDEVERLSLAYADQGMYQSAYDLLSSMGYTTVESDVNYLPILKAYRYAGSGDYKSAVLYGLEKIVIPDGTTEIGKSMFEDCTGLLEIVLPDTVTQIGEYAFSGCKNLKVLVLPSQLRTVGRSAFSNCDALDKLILPLSLESIVTYGLNSIDGEIHYEGTVNQWEQVRKDSGGSTLNKVIHCSDGDVHP